MISIGFQTVVYLMYTAVFIVSLVGNGLVCYVVMSSTQMQSVTNMFIVNMAVGDLVMTLFCVPFPFVASFLLQYWPLENYLCQTFTFGKIVAVLVSAYTLVAISLNRYRAIMWPLKQRTRKCQAKYIIAFVWTMSVITAFPFLRATSLDQSTKIHRFDIYFCSDKWPSEYFRRLSNAGLFILQCCIPFSILLFTNVHIGIVVWGKIPPGEAQNSRDIKMAKSIRKMIKMMATVVIAFVVCWLPYDILLVLRAYGMSLRAWSNQPYVWFAFHWLAISHTCYNPLIYFCMNTRYRAGFVSALRSVPGLGYVPARQDGDGLPGPGWPRAPSEVLVRQFRLRAPSEVLV
ncbi:RYamide receptor-like isoform X1 [Metopolophium dirhodum]|uniref:RYamide receptor-like isoform X1 n=2 Tax=Metopolophium dirhodum TaxID=44670 RepID=UPI002990728F|nr:RYamide receptor-like isoform X1 [Metopolophium dirhodum]